MKSENGPGGVYKQYDSSAIVLISAWPKVKQVLDRAIPNPEVVEIFPTNFCNFACPHCRFQCHHGDSSQYMDLTSLDALLAELSGRQVRAVELSGGGEPFEHPQAEEFLERLAAAGFRLGIITNGYKLIASDRLKDLVLKAGNWVRFSVDGFTDDVYRAIHGRKNVSYSSLRPVLAELARTRREILSVEMKMLISTVNVDEWALAVQEALALGIDCLQFKFLGSHPLQLDDAKMLEIKDKLAALVGATSQCRIEVIPSYRGPKAYEKCLMTFLHPVIDWDGQIYVCAFFEHRRKEHSLGNIHNGGFFRHWDDPKHWLVFDSIDPGSCVPNCPMLRYIPVIEFIKTHSYRFPFI